MNNETLPKSAWGDGPWQNEPDRLEWVDEKTGYTCLANRARFTGVWCGYVAIPESHPCHGKPYDSLDIDVHGGLTYGHECQGIICHETDDKGNKAWWFGFDCSHSGDCLPAMKAHLRKYGGADYAALEKHRERLLSIYGEEHFGEVYRDLDYIKMECKILAQQLKNKE